MFQKLVVFLEQNLDQMVELSLVQARERFGRYRSASEIEMQNIRETMRAIFTIAFQVLLNKKIAERELDDMLVALAERRARQGYPLTDVMGMFQVAQEVSMRYLKKGIEKHPGTTLSELLDFFSEIQTFFHRLEVGLVEPYLRFQENIINVQQSFMKHKFSSLFKLVEAISNNLNIQEFCEILLDYVCRFYDVKISGVYLFDEKEKELYPQHATGLSRRYKNEVRLKADADPYKKCLEKSSVVSAVERPFHIDALTVSLPGGDLRKPNGGGDEKQNNPEEDYPECHSLYAPMVGRQKTYGLVSLHSLKPRQYNQNEIQQFETLARILAVALENARFYQNLIEEKGKLDAIVNSVTEGLVLIDFHEEIVFINDQAARYFQQPSYKLVGASASIIPEQLLRQTTEPYVVQAAYLHALTTIMEQPVLECTLQKPELADIRLVMFPVRDRERHFIGRGIVIKDISQEKEIHRMKSEFVAIASHTMRTPMTSILGFTSLLLEKKPSEEIRQKYVHSIHRELQRLTNILDDMLDLMNIEAGKVSLKLMPFYIQDLVAAAIAEIKEHIQQEISVQMVGKSLPRLIGDQRKIQQVLIKLFSNALKYSSGKIKLSVKKVSAVKMKPGWVHSKVQFKSPGLFPAVLFGVEDDGEGIAADQIDAMFEPFYRINNAQTRGQEGTGLGLTIAKYIVESHGGKIWAESKNSKGSVISFLLPLELTSIDKGMMVM